MRREDKEKCQLCGGIKHERGNVYNSGYPICECPVRHGKQRRIAKDMTRHHIKARSLGGADSDDNIILKSVLDHRAWHQLFGRSSPKEAIQIIIKYWTKKGVLEDE